MTKTIRADDVKKTDWHENAYDILRGLSAYTGSTLIEGLARVVAHHPDAEVGTAFNHKQIGSKIWARDCLFESLGGTFRRILLLGGWYGVLPAMLFDDSRFSIGWIDSIDIDPQVARVAATLNASAGARFTATTQDMYSVDYTAIDADLVINTSCEHIADLSAWLALLPRGAHVLLQSNDYFQEPTHISSVPTLQAFREQASLSAVAFEGALAMKNYTRFMLIGTV